MLWLKHGEKQYEESDYICWTIFEYIYCHSMGLMKLVLHINTKVLKLLEGTKVAKLCLSTRHHMGNELENKLIIFSERLVERESELFFKELLD